jgi:HEAT repeat protein
MMEKFHLDSEKINTTITAEQIIQLLEQTGVDLLPIKISLQRNASVKELVKALSISKKTGTSRILCDILGYRKAKSAKPELIKCLKSRSEWLREDAAEAIGRIGGEEAGEELINQLVKRPNVWIAIALGAIKYAPAIPFLREALNSPYPKLRGGAAWSLGHLKDKEALSALERVLQTETDTYSKDRITEAIIEITSA